MGFGQKAADWFDQLSWDEEFKALAQQEQVRRKLLDAWLGPDNDDELLEPYKHKPLTGALDDEIRLVRLLPGSDWEPIKVEIFVSTLRHGFETLSYCWGSTAILSRITCAGQCLLVTQNLKSALRNLRRPKNARIMWIDAIW